MAEFPESHAVDFMCNSQHTFKKIAELIGIPENFMQFSLFVEELQKIVKLSCSKSSNERIQQMYEKFKNENFFCSISDEYMDLAEEIAKEIKTGYSHFHPLAGYSRWLGNIPSAPDLGDYRAVKVDDQGRVLIQKFTPSDAKNRSAIHLVYSIDEGCHLREDEFIEDTSGRSYSITYSDVYEKKIKGRIYTFGSDKFVTKITNIIYGDEDYHDYYKNKKPQHATTIGDITKSYKPEYPSSFANYISKFLPGYLYNEPDADSSKLTPKKRPFSDRDDRD